MDIGAELRQAREARGVSLIELSRRTKIRPAILRAIDSSDFAQLPGGIFTRSFLKTYAREVGLDPDAVAQQYAIALNEEAAAARQASQPTVAEPPEPYEEEGVRASTVVAWLAIAAAAFLAVSIWQRSDTAAQQPTLDVPAPVATAGTVAPPPAVAAAAAQLRVELHARGPCWVEATADGVRTVYRLMNDAEREVVEARSEVVLRAGDPTSLDVFVNGSKTRPLGAAGQPATMRIAAGDFESLLPNRQ